ncbi:hypothetical protein GA0070616_3731 [Micromonospora nigra]|uniref:Helix-turn-helix domain-containing protein n=1 Tax=Micromonospora nigra TaxID=145857 RepID=A0A1C6SGR6_9ACTN|nr:hypothetical protein [Micromonospora nigra]SCL28632.1 hypothetical protein GA0070616_3731 [Micromonospora nigra]
MARLPVTHANCPRCGGRLARDNDSGRCAPCQAAERDRLSAPPTVPATFWKHEPLRRALAERHLGRVIRAYRCHPYHGRSALPQTVVAGWLGITQAQLSRVENGPPLVHLDRLTHWAQLLRVPAHLLWFQLPSGSGGTDARPAVPSIVVEESNEEVVTTDRRQFTVLAALAGLTAGDHLGLLTAPADAAPAIGMEHVRLTSTLVEQLRQTDAAVGANELCDVAIKVHARLAAWAEKARYGREVGEALQSAIADLSIEAAWLAIDSGRRAEARPYLNEAITRARIADDPRVEARALAQLSLLVRDTQPRESLDCAEAALRVSAGWGTPRLKALLHLRRAHAFSVLRDSGGFEREIAKARRELDHGAHEDDQGFVHFVNVQEMHSIRGSCYLSLGNPGRAAEAHRLATENPSTQLRRNQVSYSVHLAEATYRQGDVNQAARMALAVLPEVRQISSQRVTRHLGQIRANMGRNASSTLAVREFIDAYDQQVTL